MGFYLQGATGLNADYGFTSFTASANDVNPVSEPSTLFLVVPFLIRIIGDLVPRSINDVQMYQVTDDTFSSGSPGKGFYLQGTRGLNADYGSTSFTANANGVNTVPEPSSMSLFALGSAVLTMAFWRRRKRTT
jgi:hypothetical protein